MYSPAQKVVHPSKGLKEGQAKAWMQFDEIEGKRKQLSHIGSRNVLPPPVIHQA